MEGTFGSMLLDILKETSQKMLCSDFKNNIGPKLRARTSRRQEVEIKLGVHILNQMTRLGMSDSVRIR